MAELPPPTFEARDVPLRVLGHQMLASCLAWESPRREVLYLRIGDSLPDEPLTVRVHSSCLAGEVLQSARCDCAWQLQHAVETIAEVGCGAVVYLPQHDGRGAGVGALLRSYQLMDQGMTSAKAFTVLGHSPDVRSYDHAIAALKEFGVENVRLMTNNPDKVAALEAAGIRVSHREPSVVPDATASIHRVLEGKARDLGHLIDRDAK